MFLLGKGNDRQNSDFFYGLNWDEPRISFRRVGTLDRVGNLWEDVAVQVQILAVYA